MSWLSSLKSVFTPAQEVKEEEVQSVLQNYILPNSSHSLKERITQVNVVDRVLQLTIHTYPEEAEHLQKIHDDLADALEKCGIQELNMHVIQQKIQHDHSHSHSCSSEQHGKAGHSCSSKPKAENKNLPPVVDASTKVAPVETDPNNPPI